MGICGRPATLLCGPFPGSAPNTIRKSIHVTTFLRCQQYCRRHCMGHILLSSPIGPRSGRRRCCACPRVLAGKGASDRDRGTRPRSCARAKSRCGAGNGASAAAASGQRHGPTPRARRRGAGAESCARHAAARLAFALGSNCAHPASGRQSRSWNHSGTVGKIRHAGHPCAGSLCNKSVENGALSITGHN